MAKKPPAAKISTFPRPLLYIISKANAPSSVGTTLACRAMMSKSTVSDAPLTTTTRPPTIPNANVEAERHSDQAQGRSYPATNTGSSLVKEQSSAADAASLESYNSAMAMCTPGSSDYDHWRAGLLI